MGNSLAQKGGSFDSSKSAAELSDVAELSISIRQQNLVRSRNDSGRNQLKVISEVEAHRRVAEKNLKISLTHPTIVKYLRVFMREQGETQEYLLNYYLDAAKVRDMFKDNGSEFIELLNDLVTNYVAKDGKFAVPINERFRHMILMNYTHESTRTFAIEGIKLAQYEVFYVIQVCAILPVYFLCLFLIPPSVLFSLSSSLSYAGDWLVAILRI